MILCFLQFGNLFLKLAGHLLWLKDCSLVYFVNIVEIHRRTS